MAMGTRQRRQRQESLWIAAAELPGTAAHPFYERLNQLLDEEGFDRFVEALCARYYADRMGRPSLTPGIYFRLLLIGYFEGIDSERGIAWRAADSLGLRRFLSIAMDENTPDHSTISRTRRLISLETHQEVFGWVLRVLAERGLVKGTTVAVDATTVEANPTSAPFLVQIGCFEGFGRPGRLFSTAVIGRAKSSDEYVPPAFPADRSSFPSLIALASCISSPLGAP